MLLLKSNSILSIFRIIEDSHCSNAKKEHPISGHIAHLVPMDRDVGKEENVPDQLKRHH